MQEKKSLTSTDIKLIKQQAIREYRLRSESNSSFQSELNSFLKILKMITPINIIIGIGAAIFLVYLEGWKELFETLIIATIWITLVSTIIGGFAKK